jgi:hypothetical protein
MVETFAEHVRRTAERLEVGDVRPCDSCGEGLARGGIDFYLVKLEQAVIDPGSVHRFAGLTALVGGSVQLAAAMGDPTVARVVPGTRRLILCRECVYGSTAISLAQVLELQQREPPT